VFVLTHRPPNISDDPGIIFLSAGIEGAVATARVAAEGKNLEIFGANIARQCLEADLLDEIAVHLAPVLLGDGVRFYGAPSAGRVSLTRTILTESGQLIDLRFRLLKQSR
jgi:dihydrofolate reductase